MADIAPPRVTPISSDLPRPAAGLLPESPGGSCDLGQPLDPCAVVIFGASGDLTFKKLFPSLYGLFAAGRVPGKFAIVGCARTDMTDDSFRERMRQAVFTARADADPEVWNRLAGRLYYQRLEYDQPDGYHALANMLGGLERQEGAGANRLFYLATPPTLYGPIAEMLGQAGLAREREDGLGWARFVVEKPFGRDLASARELDRHLHATFREEQIYRIDHYLAKETVQNILTFRFTNAIFEPIWNRNYIDYVSIIAAESEGVDRRAGYYESAGVLRDMFQNHMMQLLALSAMEPPSVFQADRVRDEKNKVYRSLRPFQTAQQDGEGGFRDLALGQYGPGSLNGQALAGYRQEEGVNPASVTPTFAMLKVHIDNWRWQGVPFYLSSGKRLARKVTRIVVQFKEAPHSMFREILGEHITANRLIFGIHPDEAINLRFQAKQPGPRLCLRSMNMGFDFNDSGEGESDRLRLDAYEKVLLDCMLGDQTLFWRQDAVELCWGYLTPILEMCERCGDLPSRLLPYAAGSWGPEAAGMVNLNYLRDHLA